jgi:hypothetical protein
MVNSQAIRRVVVGIALVASLAAPLVAMSATKPPRGSSQYDPFKRKATPKPAPAKQVLQPSEIAPPGLTQRLQYCETRSTVYGESARTTPCPYLVGELKIKGIIDGDEITAVGFVQPTNQSVFLRVGDKLFDGEVVSINEATVDEAATVVFKKHTRYRARGGDRVESKNVTMRLAP